MTRQWLSNIIAAAVAAVIGVAIVLSFFWGGADSISAAKQTEGLTDAKGRPVAAVSILDLAESNVITSVNYAPREFLKLSPAMSGGAIPFGAPVDISSTEFAEEGTLRFVVLNIDPWAEDFSAQQKALAPYLGADNNWHFSLYLPPIFSSCVVYTRASLAATAGLISDYSFIEYSEYNYDSVVHKDGSEPFVIDLSFPSKRETILANRLMAAVDITIHYQGVSGNAVGLQGMPVIGSPDAVQSLVERDNSALTASLIVSALALAVFVFLCFLKRTISFLPQPLMTLGVFGVLLSGFFLAQKTASPYVWQAAGLFSFSFILLSALLALRVSLRKKPIWLVPSVFALTNCALSFVAPLASSYAELAAYLVVGNTITACIVLLFAAVKTRDAVSPLRLVNPVLAGVAAVAAAFYPRTAFAFTNPVLWLFFLMIATTVVVSFREFITAEKRNRYLTANLSEEVARQTKDLTQIIAERDKILLYVSHDMKKPVVFMEGAISDLKQYLDDKRLLAKAELIQQKNADLKKDFAELSKLSKLNYVAELSEVFNAAEAARGVCDEMRPDCDANNILLTITAPATLNVYAKKQGLCRVLVNLILNSIEHSQCSRICVSVSKRKDVCRIEVADDGRGITTDKDIFKPYLSGSDNAENSGLGLYLALSAVRSMGGDLTYAQTDGVLTFTITVPLA